MTAPTPPHPLSSLSDPVSLAKLQILLVPVNTPSSSISAHTFSHWSSLIRRHTVLRGDELARPLPPAPTSHARGSTGNPRTRFLPASSSTSISRGGAPNHVHLVYPAHPPARHLSNLSLLRVSAFPLVVLGIAAEDEPAQGYAVSGDQGGDIGESSKTATTRGAGEGLDESFGEVLAGLFPPTSPFPLVKRLIVVPKDTPAPHSSHSSPRKNRASAHGTRDSGHSKGKSGVEMVYAPAEGVESWLGRLLGEVVGDVLGELGELATALETPQGLKTLSSTLLPSLTSTLPHPHLETLFPGQATSATPTLEHPRSRSVTPVSLPHSQSADTLATQSGLGISLTRALTPGGRPTSVGPPSLPPIQTSAIAPTPPPAPQSASSNPFRRSTALSSPFTRSSSSVSLAATANSNAAPQVPNTGTKYTSAPLSGLAGGRLLKLLGDMYLLAGMYSDAIKCFDDGAERCRAVGDVLWEAVAREGRAVAGIGDAWEGRDGSNMTQAFPSSPIPVEILSHFLSALACLSRAPMPYPPTILSPSPQAVSGSVSFAGPAASVPGFIGTGEGLLAYLHTGLALRISHFLLIIWAASGWGSVALSSLLSHTLPRSFPQPLSPEEVRDSTSRRKRKRALGLLGSKSLLSRASIYDHAGSALGPHHRAMTKMEQLAIHVEVAWLARWLDLPRKEACVTREVVRRIGVMVVEAREENRRQNAAGFAKRTSVSSAETTIGLSANAAVGLGLGIAVPSPSSAVAVRRRESTEGNEGVMALFERALSLMGLDLLDFASSESEPVSKGDEEETLPLSRFGWPELQVEMVKEGIAVAEALPDHVAVVRFCTTALNVLYRHLNPPSQVHVAKMFPAALSVIKRRGMDTGALPWWVPGKVVLSLEIASLPPNRLPIEHSSAEISMTEGKRDPFLYNPRTRAAEAGKTVIVANEQTEVFVTMQNPFAFDLDVQDISLITTGVPFVTNPHPIALGPGGFQTVRLSGVATAPGSLEIRGVTLRLQDGSITDILLPHISDKERSKRDKRKSRVIADVAKSKRQGMEARWSMASQSSGQLDLDRRTSTSASAPATKWLECKVVEEQPVVWIKKTSLTHGTVMLYNGETSTIKITLENSSSTPVDFVKLSFDDSASRAATAMLAEGESTGERAYELEWDAIHRPVFTWNGETDVAIPPGSRTTLSITCLGKVGCTDGTIRIDYGYLHRQEGGNVPKTFQTRQITFPVLFTVYHTLDAHSLDLVKLVPADPTSHPTENEYLAAPPALSRKSSGGITPRGGSFPAVDDALAREQLGSTMDGKHCLVGLSISNSYGVPFEVSLVKKALAGDADEGEVGEISTKRLVPPGATERLILPFPRLSIPVEELARPIPKLSDRQHVVEKLKKTAEQLRADRELFWYRERLLSSLEATWVEPGSRRSGTISLREQDLTTAQLDVLRVDALDIVLEVVPREGDRCLATEFVDLAVKINNRLERSFRPYIRLEPLPSSSFDTSWTSPAGQPSRRPQSTLPIALRNVVFDGTLAQSLGEMQPGDEVEMKVGVVFLAEGTFGFRAAVEEMDLDNQKAADGVPGALPIVRFSEVLSVDVEA